MSLLCMKDEISVRMKRVSRCRGLMSMRGGDFAAMANAGRSFCAVSVGAGEISSTSVRREPRKRIPTVRDVCPAALCGSGTEASGDDLPVVAVDAGGGQVQHDAPHRGLHPGAQLHEVFAQGAHLG